MKLERTARGIRFEAEPRDLEWLRERHDEDPDAFDSDAVLYDLFEHFTGNSEYDWLAEGTTGDLTSAPMLGVLGQEVPGPASLSEPGSGYLNVGRWPDKWGESQLWYQPVIERFAFMNYMVTSPQRELLERGEAFFEGGSYLAETIITERQESLIFSSLTEEGLTPSSLRRALSRAGIAVTEDEGSEATQ
jgi:hypothetical protein